MNTTRQQTQQRQGATGVSKQSAPAKGNLKEQKNLKVRISDMPHSTGTASKIKSKRATTASGVSDLPAGNTPPGGFDFSVLRLLRKREGLTLDALSNASGVSVAVLSKLERNQSRAELDTLYKLARAFDISAGDLIALAEARLAKGAQESRYEHDGFHFRKITYANSSCFYGTAKKGGAVRRPEIHHDDYETCWVLKGCIRINLPQESRKIRAGESVQFDAVLEHTYEALEDSEFILTHVRKANRL